MYISEYDRLEYDLGRYEMMAEACDCAAKIKLIATKKDMERCEEWSFPPERC